LYCISFAMSSFNSSADFSHVIVSLFQQSLPILRGLYYFLIWGRAYDCLFAFKSFCEECVSIESGLKKGTTPAAEKNKNILDEMNINKAREIQIVSNPFSSLFAFVPVQ
jgi:hypothetical protein